MFHRLRRLALLLIPVALAAGLTACGDDPAPISEGTPAPAPFVSPVDHREYCGWVNNPHECDDSGYPAAPFAMPSSDIDRSAAGVGDDFGLLDALLLHHIMYHSFYNNPWYYDSYISPAWSAYPGTYYAWGGRPVVRVTNVKVYTTSSRTFDHRYRARERATESRAKYKDPKTGKSYTGKNVPRSKFSGTNAKPARAGNAPKAKRTPKARPSRASKPGSTGGYKPPAARPKPPAPRPPAPRPAPPRPKPRHR